MPQLAWAERPEGEDRPHMSREEMRDKAAEAWKKADTNNDGMISRGEFDLMPRLQKLTEEKRNELFLRLDKNGDGMMDKEDMSKIRDQRKDPMQRLWELDKDKSGGVSFEEFQQGRMSKRLDAERQKAIFDRLDENGDGVISPDDKPKRPKFRPDDKPDEMDRADRPKDRMRPGAMMEKLDADKDGAVSYDEFKNTPWNKDKSDEEVKRRFERADKNKDGQLTKDDFARMRDREGRDAGKDGERPSKKPNNNIE